MVLWNEAHLLGQLVNTDRINHIIQGGDVIPSVKEVLDGDIEFYLCVYQVNS